VAAAVVVLEGAWALREAGIAYKLSRKGLGQNYLAAKQ
jgi:hypothetical protein